jgi:hypothetical protein
LVVVVVVVVVLERSKVKETHRKASHQVKMKEMIRVIVLMMKMMKMGTGELWKGKVPN